MKPTMCSIYSKWANEGFLVLLGGITLFLFIFSSPNRGRAQISTTPIIEDSLSRKQLRKREVKSRAKYLYIKTGLGRHKIRDYQTSPLTYKGGLAHFGGGYYSHSEKRVKHFDLDYQLALMVNDKTRAYELPALLNRFDAKVYYLYQVRKFWKEKLNWYLGWNVHSINNFRVNTKFNNAAFNYDLLLNIGISSRIEFPFQIPAFSFRLFKKDRNWQPRKSMLSFELLAPVLGFVNRPGFITIYDFPDPTKSPFPARRDFRYAGLGALYSITTDWSYHHYFKNGNALRFTYLWNYYQYSEKEDRLQSAMHIFRISALLRLNKLPENQK